MSTSPSRSEASDTRSAAGAADSTSRGQVTDQAATVYENFFVPALFGQWTAVMLDAAEVRSGDRVLDVACGTGVLARAAAGRVAPHGQVTGVDINTGMLAVAHQHNPAIDWRHAAAEALPFESARFDRVVCQFGLMFFTDQTAALQEMMRVVRPGGRVAVAVWDRAEASPGYARLIALLQRLFGDDAAAALRAPFALGDLARLSAVLTDADLTNTDVRTYPGTARFASLRDWMTTDVRGWTLADQLDDDDLATLIDEAGRDLATFIGPDGTISFAAPAHVVTLVRE